MKFTAQEEYGFRCVLNLAREDSSAEKEGRSSFRTCLTVSEIARREGLSVQYAGKLFRVLARAEIVQSVRGRKGGYRLRRAPSSVTVAEVLAALGGKMYEPGLCDRYRGHSGLCVHTEDCSVRSLWVGLQEMIDRVLSRTTLGDLARGESAVAGHMEVEIDAADRHLGSPGSRAGRKPVLLTEMPVPMGLDSEPSPSRQSDD